MPLAHWCSASVRARSDAAYVGGSLLALAIGLVPFTVQYVCLRAFYALEKNRTTFFLQCVIAGANVGLRRRSRVADRDRPRSSRPVSAWPTRWRT